ncbi:hypothetical protein [Kitasatospora sp. NPDC057500]|uniref:hypothetical protein n=1 Tax=Kitasatospora sp. NPDC057500 TaxID=3346151 RepID=UPI0036C528C7
MGSLFADADADADAAVVEDDDAIRVLGGAEPVRDQDDGPTGGEFADAVVSGLLGPRIHRYL